MEEFTVAAPCSFFETEEKQDWKIYKCHQGDKWFFITSNIDEKSSQIEVIKRQASANITTSKGRTGPLANRYATTRLSFPDHDGMFQNVVSVATSQRYYIFHVVSDVENDPAATSFIESITIDRPPSAERSKPRRPESILSIVSKTRSNERISRENAALYKNPNVGRQYVPNAYQTSQFKLLKREPAAYTELAFLYEVQGTVILHVTFESSGQIGRIRTDKKLPLGLTANSMAAAKFMVFEPLVEKGEARTISRPVHYKFSIY